MRLGWGRKPASALEEARLDVATKQEAARLAPETFEAAEQNADDVTVNAELLACAEQIKHLVDAAGGARTARDDLPGRQTEHDFSPCPPAMTCCASSARPSA